VTKGIERQEELDEEEQKKAMQGSVDKEGPHYLGLA
jgi:hypothetical protein